VSTSDTAAASAAAAAFVALAVVIMQVLLLEQSLLKTPELRSPSLFSHCHKRRNLIPVLVHLSLLLILFVAVMDAETTVRRPSHATHRLLSAGQERHMHVSPPVATAQPNTHANTHGTSMG